MEENKLHTLLSMPITKYVGSALIAVLITLFFTSIYIGKNETERGGSWIYEYKYNGKTKVYFVPGEKIDDYRMHDYIVLENQYVLLKDSIVNVYNSIAYGKQAVQSPDSRRDPFEDEEEYYEAYDDYYFSTPKENLIIIK